MAPRRGRNTKIVNNVNYNNLSITDVLCPICRSILSQPVTLPCNHGFCYTCFEGTMQNANLACPLCRVRISSWYRIAKKENRLVNEELWKYVREKFPKQLENKLNEIDEEDPVSEVNISIAAPGEIRKEYEIQRQKELEELKLEREAEEKASEQLIAKLKKEELEYQETVKEEQDKKVKMDEQIAKKLSVEWCKTINNKKGPLDQFLIKGSNGSCANNLKTQNYATKEYTCRVLYLDKESDLSKPSTSKGYTALPFIQKKIQQLQKVVSNDGSDSSDCIEQECRYFKPIDYKHNPRSQGKTPIKIPIIKANINVSATIRKPSGEMNFRSNILESAFARIALQMPIRSESQDNTLFQAKGISTPSARPSLLKSAASVKRKAEEDIATKPKKQFQVNAQEFVENTSPKLNNGAINIKCRNSTRRHKTFDEEKIRQEKSDFEFAMKLQEELNRTNQYSTRSQISSTRKSRRQITLDEIVANTYKVK